MLAHYGGWLVERLSRRALAGKRGGVIVTAGVVAREVFVTATVTGAVVACSD